MWKINQANLYCNNFEFGVPLEDLFFREDLHPKIDLLYNCALKCFQEKEINSDYFLNSKDEGPLEKIKLKKMILTRNYLTGSPQSFIWLIEHFLGMLPIPLLPKYTNGLHFDWLDLSKKCEKVFQTYHKERCINYEWDNNIAAEISRLPILHYYLLNLHIHFIRKISFFIKGNENRRKNIIFYTKYFTPSIFLRPFRPGLKQQIKEYYHIILYMILRWPFILDILCKIKLNFLIEENLKNKFNTFDCDVMKEHYNITVKNTIFGYPGEDIENFQADIETFSPNILNATNNNLPYVVDSISQEADTYEDEIHFTPTEKRIQNKLSRIQEESYIYDDYDTFKNEKYNQISNSDNESEVKAKYNCSERSDIPKLCPSSMTIYSKDEGDHNGSKESEFYSKSKQIESYHTDCETNRNMEENTITKIVPSSLILKNEVTDNCSEINDENRDPPLITISTDMLRRVSKLGWTYTPQKENNNINPNHFSGPINNEIDDEKLIKNSTNDKNLKKNSWARKFKSKFCLFSTKSMKKNMDNKFKYTKICS